MKKWLTALSVLIAASALIAQECTWRVKDVEVKWKAFKTPARIGVEGTFGNIKLSAMPDKTQRGLLEGTKVVIDTASVDTKNAGRDAKLVKSFFNVQGVDRIEAVVTGVHEGNVDVNVTMNGVSRIVPMKSEWDGDEVKAEGWIDLADFDMLPSLQAINKACYDKHAGKTWQEVELKFELKTYKKCK